MPTFGSLFSGIGGMDLGLERAGWECKWQVELDDWRRQVLTRHWPEVPKWKDVREFGDSRYIDGLLREEQGHAGRQGQHPSQLSVDLICGGFPCQDLSVAGRRAGLAGDRSGLFFEFARIAGELRPQWLLIENVPGLLSSNQGLDFAVVLNTLDELGYGVAWRILNSQFFGVPQRRRRVFIVGHLGDPCPPEILFESESGGGNPQTGGKAGENIAHALRSSPRGVDEHTGTTYVAATLRGETHSGGGRTDGAGNLVADTLSVGANQTFGFAGEAVAAPLEAADGHHGRSGPRGDGADNLVAGTVTGAEAHNGNSNPIAANLIAQPLRSNRWGGSDSHGDEGNVVSVESRIRGDDGRGYEREPRIRADGIAWTLQAMDCGNVCAPVDPDGVRETTGLSGWLDACSRCPDGRRYAALGDAVTVPVAEWIGRRIIVAEGHRLNTPTIA